MEQRNVHTAPSCACLHLCLDDISGRDLGETYVHFEVMRTLLMCADRPRLRFQHGRMVSSCVQVTLTSSSCHNSFERSFDPVTDMSILSVN